jgi:hypothetical protein
VPKTVWRMKLVAELEPGLTTVQPFLGVRTAVLNDTLADAFPHHYPGFRLADNNEPIAATA